MSPLSVSNTLSAISNDKSLVLFNTIALSPANTDFLIARLKLTKKQYYSRISDLINAGLIIKKSGNYFLSSFGKIVYEAHMLIGKGTRKCWTLKAIDSFESSDVNHKLPAEEYSRIIDALMEGSNEIKNMLLRYNNSTKDNNNIAVAPKEKAYDNQELVVSVPARASSRQFDR
jgi:hypothetical protein